MKDIIKLKPYLRSTLWGGEKLKSLYGFKSSSNIAEAWTLSSNCDGMTYIDNGEYAGMPYGEYLKTLQLNFPLLIKYIDSVDNLSIQVHPNDTQALSLNGEKVGKAEFWYILDCEPDSFIYVGFDKSISKDSFLISIQENLLCNYLHKIPVHKGDFVYIPPGTVHSMSKGITLLEISQNSNITYRIYDYNRRDSQGNARELHLDKAVQVLDFNTFDSNLLKKDTLSNATLQLHNNGYFKVQRLLIGNKVHLMWKEPTAICIVYGNGVLNDKPFKAGETYFSAPNEDVTLDGNAIIVLVFM